jgi:hypothetical protein
MTLHAKYESNLTQAKEFEDFASDAMAHSLLVLPVVYRSAEFQQRYGESLSRIEFKLDQKFMDTGNLYIETAESWAEYVEKKPAGIYHHTSPWLYVIGDFQQFWIFATRCLQRQFESKKYRCVETPTSDGFLLPLHVADVIRAEKWEA